MAALESGLELLCNVGDVAELIFALDKSMLQLDFTAALYLTACYKCHQSSMTVTPTAPSVHFTTAMTHVLKSFSCFGLFLLSPSTEWLVITGIYPQLIFFFGREKSNSYFCELK